VLLIGALLAAGCDNDPDTPETPTEPTPVTDTFTGNINVNGAMTHTFAIARNGVVTATLTAVTPDPAIQVGFGLGTWNGSNCQMILTKDDAVQGNAVTGIANIAGTLCLRIQDNGKLTGSVGYTVTVSHP
jgi:hypothetical protein